MAKSVFFDPQLKRWKLLRRLLDVAGIAITLVMALFLYTAMRSMQLPDLLLPQQKPRYHAIKEREKRRPKLRRVSHRKTKSPPSQVVLNTQEGIRAAFYVAWDAASFASLREYVHQIDLLYPEWLHVLTPDGRLQAVTADNKLFDVLKGDKVRPVDDKVMPFLKAEQADTEVFPLVNNFDPISNEWVEAVGGFFNDAPARADFRRQVLQFLASDRYKGLTLDFEAFPAAAQPGYQALLGELVQDLHARGLKLYVNVPANNPEFDYAFIAAHSDGVILMNYDEHYPGGDIGPVSSQAWFTRNLEHALKLMPREKILCSIGNYGYDWAVPVGQHARQTRASITGVSVQDAWLHASESDATIQFDPDFLNPYYVYMEGDNLRHEVWFLDAVTALNQMRAAQRLGLRTFALWRLGAEDRSLWAIWDQPGAADAPDRLRSVPPGQDVDLEGHGEVLWIQQRPQDGERALVYDPDSALVTDEIFHSLPSPYQVAQYGASDKLIAITFDDGPDPKYTPRMLDILKAEHAPATFFLIGIEAEKYPDLTQRIFDEGHEVGNHTFTHPDISAISPAMMNLEINLTERLFASKLGVKPLFFRPPYSIDQDPETEDEVKPLEFTQDAGYTTVGSKLDPHDWQVSPHRTAEQITADVLDHLPPCQPGDQRCGNILLLHDGGGNREESVRALPMIIRGARARGYRFVLVSELLGRSRQQVMAPLSPNEIWTARVDAFSFWLGGVLRMLVVLVFFAGDVLMSLRLLIVGALAIADRLRTRRNGAPAAAPQPPVAVLVPAYNEEKVIEGTVRSVLASRYPSLRVIVIDDGSRDATLAVAHNAFREEIAQGRVLVLSQANAGKAEALSLGLAHVTEDIFVGIDADTVIAPEAIARLVAHFADPRVGAVAGNTKVGNRVNLWTRWQALEYITSQNFERRALNTLGAVSVVPGALGAWRTAAVRQAGGFHPDTVAEDADLTMSLLERGYQVKYEDRALAYTEAPTTAGGLMRQRFRWSFGILQSVWKHRRAVLRGGTLGWVAIPNIVVFQILLPLVSPFIDIMYVLGALGYAYAWTFHRETADPTDLLRLTWFFAIFLVVDFIASTIAFALERREEGKREDAWLLPQVWAQRFAYRQLFSIVLFKTLKRAVDGRQFSWDKLERTATALPHARG